MPAGRPLDYLQQAIDGIRQAAPKAVATLVRLLDDPTGQTALLAARELLDRAGVVPPRDDPEESHETAVISADARSVMWAGKRYVLAEPEAGAEEEDPS